MYIVYDFWFFCVQFSGERRCIIRINGHCTPELRKRCAARTAHRRLLQSIFSDNFFQKLVSNLKMVKCIQNEWKTNTILLLFFFGIDFFLFQVVQHCGGTRVNDLIRLYRHVLPDITEVIVSFQCNASIWCAYLPFCFWGASAWWRPGWSWKRPRSHFISTFLFFLM